MSDTTAGAGWFPDPGDPTLLRYWDGSAWTEHTSPMPQPAPAAPGVAAPVRATGPTDGLAIASLVLSLLWIFWIGSILAVIFGHIALSRIKQSGGTIGGRGLAIAGLILGYIPIGFFVLSVIGGVLGSTTTT